MTDTVIARFEGDGSGVAELSRGQLTRSTLTCGRIDVLIGKVFVYIDDISEALCYELQKDRAVPAMGAVR